MEGALAGRRGCGGGAACIGAGSGMSLVQTPANEAYLKSLGELLAAAGFKVFIADILTSPGARSSENEVEISSSVADSVAGNPNV